MENAERAEETFAWAEIQAALAGVTPYDENMDLDDMTNKISPAANFSSATLQKSYRGWMKDHKTAAETLNRGILSSETYYTSHVAPSIDPSNGLRRRSEDIDENLLAGLSTAFFIKPRSFSPVRDRPADADAVKETPVINKKVRGRPRLDNPKETAADRRRAQIRVAQRAYRMRKESTIAVLETKNQQLEKIIEEMNSTFLNVYDTAMACPRLQRACPDVKEQLRDAVKGFLILAQAAQEDASAPKETEPCSGKRPKGESG